MDGIGKCLNDIRMRLNIAIKGRETGIWDIAGVFTERCNNMPVAVHFQRGSKWFKFYGIVGGAAGKSFGRQSEIHILDDGQVSFRVNVVEG